MPKHKTEPQTAPPTASDEAPRMGRPAVAEEDRRSIPLHVLTNKVEREILDRAAKAAGTGTSSWVRLVALEKASNGSAK